MLSFASRVGLKSRGLKLYISSNNARRYVATLSPLASAFNTRNNFTLKQLQTRIGHNNVGLFGIPELTSPTGFSQLQNETIARTEKLVEEACSGNRSRNLVTVFDELSDTLCRVADMSDFVRIGHPGGKYSSAAEQACITVSSLVEKLNTNVDIYKALHDATMKGDHIAWDDMDRRTAELFLFDFEQSGIHLPEEQRVKYVELSDAVLMLGSAFERGCQEPVTAHRSNLPDDLQYILGMGNSITVTGPMHESISEPMREATYRIFYSKDEQQEALLDQLLACRNSVARLCGFNSFSERALKGSLVQTPENAVEFLHLIADRIRPRAEADFNEILKYKSRHNPKYNNVMPWDNAHYNNLINQESLKLDMTALSEYFSLGSCMDGLDLICQSLFGVRLQHEDPEPGEVWCDDIHKVNLIDHDGSALGTIYLDLYERKGKPQRDCHFTIRGGRLNQDGTYQNPVVVLMLNLTQPRGRVPCLLTPPQVSNLFHEFGHGLHSMLGRTRHQHVCGTRCATDFVEVPSQFMEYFVSDYRVLRQFARHWETGNPIPEDKAHALSRSQKLLAASDIQVQVLYALLDQVLHGQHPLAKSTTEILCDLQQQYCTQPYVPGTAWHLRFSHLVGYGAKYYSYLMCKAVASKVWHQCFKDDPLSRSAGEAYRYKMLAHGGAKHPRLLVQDMLNEELTTSSLVDALLDDIDSHSSIS